MEKEKFNWSEEVRKIRAGGYVPPAPTWFGALFMRFFCMCLGFLEVGPIKVFGRRRLPKDGVRMVASNHTDGGDGAVLSKALGVQRMWYFIRTTECTGLRGYVAAITGAIAVNKESESGDSAGFKAMIKAMRQSPELWMMIFPQGELVPDESFDLDKFQPGAIAAAKIVAKKLKRPVTIVPMALHYSLDSKDATLLHRILILLGSKKFRNLFGRQNYRACTVVGKPMLVMHEAANPADVARGIAFPDDTKEATLVLARRIKVLHKVACKLA